jgi:hypothetical protein
MFAKLYRNLNRTARRVPRSTQLAVEILEGRALPSTLGLPVLPNAGQPGALATSANAYLVRLDHGQGGSGHIDVIGFITRSSGEEIPQ